MFADLYAMYLNLAITYEDIARLYRPEPEEFWLYWPVAGAEISQHFGENPEYYGQWFVDKYGDPLGHEGVDFAGEDIYDDPVMAGCPGTVYRVETVDNSNYGLQVRIQHGIYKVTYAHLLRVNVSVGDVVSRGDFIGLTGNSGNSTGPHVHLMLKKEGATASGESEYTGSAADTINPEPYLRKGS